MAKRKIQYRRQQEATSGPNSNKQRRRMERLAEKIRRLVYHVD